MTANNLKLRQKAIIERFANEEIRLLLNEMGIFEGEEIELALQSPLGDPICLRTDETLVSIRSNDAKLIEIKPITL